MVVWKSQPLVQVIVTHSATPYTLDAASIVVRRHENGFDIATVLLEDTQARNYVDKVANGDTIEIKQKDRSEGSWTTIFKGIIRRVEPLLSCEQGNVLNVKCDGAGYGLDATNCGEEYGTESSNPTLDTIREMVKDATNGIIPLWVNKVLGSAVDSGYSYTTYIEDIAGSIPYLYFPFKTCMKSINDICDVVQAIKGAAAGPHWIVDTSGHFLLTTIGAHSAAGDNPAQYWPTWWKTDQAGSTLEEGKDFLNFRFEQLAKEANYVLYHGRFKKPTDGDYWTENHSALWYTSNAIADDNVNYKVGSFSVKGTGTGLAMWYPSTYDAAWDFTKIGGRHNIPTLNFWARRDVQCTQAKVSLDTRDGVGGITGANYYVLQGHMPSVDTWYYFALPVGPYALASAAEGFVGWLPDGIWGAGDWSEVDDIRFNASSVNPTDFWVDGLNVQGWVLRGARQNAAFSSSDPLKLSVVTDEVGKDDSLVASDDSRLMGRLAYATYLRQSSTPIVGTCTTPIANDALPGQKIHIHAKKKSDNTFRIDKDFRVTRLIHSITDQGCLTFWDVTDDVLNANPRPIPTQINTLFAAVRPEFQDRQAASIKTREIDVTQAILEKSY